MCAGKIKAHMGCNNLFCNIKYVLCNAETCFGIGTSSMKGKPNWLEFYHWKSKGRKKGFCVAL